MHYKEIIKDICEEEKINLTNLSHDWIFKLEKDGVTKYISGTKFPLNNHSVGNIIDDKYALYEVCHERNLPIIKHHILFNYNYRDQEETKSLLRKYFYEYNQNIVLKPNQGKMGIDVHHITDENTLYEVADYLLKNNFSISLCPFYEIESEYRVIVLDREIKLIYEKIKPTVVGDGKKSIKELLLELNPEFFKNKNLDNYEQILAKGQVFVYDWRFNLSKGATARLVEDQELFQKLSRLSLKITKSLNANFVSVDIIKVKNDLLLMEINSGVCIDKVCNFIDKEYLIAKSIYRAAIQKLFQ